MLNMQIVSRQWENKLAILSYLIWEAAKVNFVKKSLKVCQPRKLGQGSIKSIEIHLKFIQLISGLELQYS